IFLFLEFLVPFLIWGIRVPSFFQFLVCFIGFLCQSPRLPSILALILSFLVISVSATAIVDR
ncbi:unnamed protein product, partial [Musa acuminata subsp. burmannicoides]